MCSVAKMMRHVVVAALLVVFASGAPRSSIIYADDKVVSDVTLLSVSTASFWILAMKCPYLVN
jgi:hypothetical protein